MGNKLLLLLTYSSIIGSLTGQSPPTEKCLKASMAPSNPDSNGAFRFPNVGGIVEVCFDDPKVKRVFPKSVTGGTLFMKVKNLNNNTIGGVHVHVGRSCDADKQGDHYFKIRDAPNGGDPWFITPSTIAPTGAGYITDANGTGTTLFAFDQGYRFMPTKGRALVIHDNSTGDNARVACGILRPKN